jgi:hypothetical protein
MKKKIKYMDYVLKNEKQLENSDFRIGVNKDCVRLRAITQLEGGKRKYSLSGKTLWKNISFIKGATSEEGKI